MCVVVKLAVIAGRLALVGGLRCEELPPLSFVADFAVDLRGALMSHPDTRITRHDLVVWHSAAATATGRLGGLLSARGPDQPDSAPNWENLARWRRRISL